MSRRVVALTGVSGVGKTAFLRRVAELIDFQHVTGGSLIVAAREAAPENRDAIRHVDLDKNQRLLVEGFLLTRDPSAEIVVMDGHVVVDNGQKLSKISCEVFKALGVSVMVHLEGDPEQTAANRGRDASRSRPIYPAGVLEQHQEISRTHAQSVADMLGIAFYIVTHNDTAKFATLLVAE